MGADAERDAEVLVVSLVRVPRPVVRVRRGAEPVAKASVHLSLEGAMAEIHEWLTERLGE